RLWGLQVDPNSGYYTGTFWEFVLQNGLPSRGFDSLSHAWGAGPTQVLTEAVRCLEGCRQDDPKHAALVAPVQETFTECRELTARASLITHFHCAGIEEALAAAGTATMRRG